MPVGELTAPGPDLLFRYTQQQRQISGRLAQIMNSFMRGMLNARVNVSAAIPPISNSPGVIDASPGLGTIIDFRA